MDDPLLRWVNQDVILGYGHADLHDCRDGQCQQEVPGRGQSRRCNDQSINRLTVVVMQCNHQRFTPRLCRGGLKL